ncbi:MAG: hypothetical protein K2K80_03515 [Clostridia bacterium]|nr:hypothetical protein [Clostridia bacterium]
MQARKYTTPVYEIKSSGGGFEASVVIMEEVFTGAGETKQQAKQSAAERAIAKLKKDGKL